MIMLLSHIVKSDGKNIILEDYKKGINMRNELKRLAKQDQSEFDHKYACWANNHNGWAKMKKLNRKLAKKRLRRLFNGELDD